MSTGGGQRLRACLIVVGLLAMATTAAAPAGASGVGHHEDRPPGAKTVGPATVPGQAVPGQTVPGQAVPGQTVPGQTVAGKTVGPPKPPTAPPARQTVPDARSYVLVDVNTGNVIAGHNERLRLPPASLTKVLTALIAVSYLPPHAGIRGTKQSENAYPNNVGIEKGVAWPLDEVLQSLLVLSANDAAYAIAQRISGKLSAFGAVMNRSAAQIGMVDDPVFHDPAGLDGTEGIDGGNLVSARDLAIAGRDLLRVPLLSHVVTEHSYDFVDPTGVHHDIPSMDYTFLVSYPGAVGIKTGFTDRAGACLLAAATRHGRTMLAVVMNGYNTTATAIDLLNQGFATRVGTESKADHLPPPALPNPAPAATHKPARPKAGAGVGAGSRGRLRSTAARPGLGRPGKQMVLAGSHRGPGPASARQRSGAAAADKAPAADGPSPGGRGRGLAPVLGTRTARALLLLAGVACLVALTELVRTNRARRRRATQGARGQSTAVITDLSGSRRRREQLVGSPRQHERQRQP